MNQGGINMKIFKTTTRKIILIIFVLAFTLNTFVYAGVNPTREELELMIDRVAEKRAIPAILLKAIARVESCYEHYKSDGSQNKWYKHWSHAD